MKLLQICYAKESGHPSGGKGVPAESVTGTPSPVAGSSAISDCPFGIPVKLRSATGEQAVGIRSEYQPNWLDENRDQPLPFTPEAWEPV